MGKLLKPPISYCQMCDWQSYRTEPLTCENWHFLQVDGGSVELKTASWCGNVACWWDGNPTPAPHQDWWSEPLNTYLVLAKFHCWEVGVGMLFSCHIQLKTLDIMYETHVKRFWKVERRQTRTSFLGSVLPHLSQIWDWRASHLERCRQTKSVPLMILSCVLILYFKSHDTLWFVTVSDILKFTHIFTLSCVHHSFLFYYASAWNHLLST